VTKQNLKTTFKLVSNKSITKLRIYAKSRTTKKENLYFLFLVISLSLFGYHYDLLSLGVRGGGGSPSIGRKKESDPSGGNVFMLTFGN